VRNHPHPGSTSSPTALSFYAHPPCLRMTKFAASCMTCTSMFIVSVRASNTCQGDMVTSSAPLLRFLSFAPSFAPLLHTPRPPRPRPRCCCCSRTGSPLRPHPHCCHCSRTAYSSSPSPSLLLLQPYGVLVVALALTAVVTAVQRPPRCPHSCCCSRTESSSPSPSLQLFGAIG
jgi:hypothetical protein